MTTCKFCDKPVEWRFDDLLEKWYPVEVIDGVDLKHRCEHYKPKSTALRSIQAEAKAQKEREWKK